MHKLLPATLAALVLLAAAPTQAQSLKGSRSSVNRQYQTAIAYGYAFVETSKGMTDIVNRGDLVRVNPTSHMQLHNVSYPYARADVKLFLNRLSVQYHNACGEKLIVTSLARPIDLQPANAAAHSVHPTGMAVDLRIPPRGRCRSWLEQTLLSLEGAEVLDVTREHRPPHYHVAVFTESYASYLAARNQTPHEYTVRPGDSLWLISARTGTTVAQLRAANGLTSDLINVGQHLQVPGIGGDASASASTVSLNETLTTVSEVSHKVRRGDTLWRLAQRYGSSVSQIQHDNGLTSTRLQIGQVLRITTITSKI